MAKAKQKLDYAKAAQNIIANIGSKENINSVRHCITRVRFRLKDESKADDRETRYYLIRNKTDYQSQMSAGHCIRRATGTDPERV